MYKIGWHYTSFGSWRKIQKKGLRPYWIPGHRLSGWSPEGTMGIWLWRKELKGPEELGSILYQVATKKALKVVKLKVVYDYDGRWTPINGDSAILYHSGNMGDWQYHDGSQEAIIYTRPILPPQIHLIQVYDLLEILKGGVECNRHWTGSQQKSVIY